MWITRGGPHYPEARGDGVLEVTEFSRTAIQSAIELAREGRSATGAPTAAWAGADSAGIHPTLRGLPVLVAEDNPLTENLIAEQLVELGCLPTIAHAAGTRRARSRGRFELVLTDVHMPGWTVQLLAALRKLRATVQVLAFSAVAEHEEAHNWRERGLAGMWPRRRCASCKWPCWRRHRSGPPLAGCSERGSAWRGMLRRTQGTRSTRTKGALHSDA